MSQVARLDRAAADCADQRSGADSCTLRGIGQTIPLQEDVALAVFAGDLERDVVVHVVELGEVLHVLDVKAA